VAQRHPGARFFAMDEARFGLKTWHRRRWSPKGFRPPWIFEDSYEWLWLYAAVEPATGENFFMYLPRLDGDCLEVFLKELEKVYPGEEIVVVLEGAPGHRSVKVRWPEGIEALPLPSYSPELNPVERCFEELRARLSNRVFETLEAIMDALSEALWPYWDDPPMLARLTGYDWWLRAVSKMETPT
jgi:DDE superfamily endonuclease